MPKCIAGISVGYDTDEANCNEISSDKIKINYLPKGTCC